MFVGWVLVNENGEMFHVTWHHQNLVWTSNVQSAYLCKTLEAAEMVKATYTTFLKNAKPMKLVYALLEKEEYVV